MGNNWEQFWTMGGYAAYIWSAYGLAAVVMLVNIAAPVIAHRRLKRRIRDEEFVDD